MKSNLIGELIVERLKAREATQTDLAEWIGVGQSSISQWINGRTRPTVDNLGRLFDVLRIDPAEYGFRELGLFDDIEAAIIAEDSALSIRDQDILLAAYGAMSGRQSLQNAGLMRARRTGA